MTGAKLAYIDLETSGIDPFNHGIVQIGCDIVIDGVLVDSFDLRPRLFKGDKISEDALAKSGTKKEELLERPMGPKAAHKAMVEVFGKYVDKYNRQDKFTFVAYNAKFDWDFLYRFFEKSGDEFFGSWFWWPPICVAVLTMNRISVESRVKLSDFTLGTLATALKVEVDPERLHDANYDLYLTRRIHEIVGVNVPKAIDR